MSRNAARKRWGGRQLVDSLAERGIQIRSPSMRGVAEEAPGAYKDVSAVVLAAALAGAWRCAVELAVLVALHEHEYENQCMSISMQSNHCRHLTEARARMT